MAVSLSTLSAVAADQFGLVTRGQALAVMSASTLSRLVERGMLIRAAKGVYRLAGAQVSWRQRALAACLAAGEGAAVSHLAAAYLWQSPSVVPPPLQLVVPRDRHLRACQPVPRRVVLHDGDVTARWGIAVTTPVRTVVDLVAEVELTLVERVFDDFLRGRRLTVGQLAAVLEPGGRLRPRTRRVIEEMIGARSGRGEGASPREDWAYDAIVAAGLPPPVRQHRLEVDGQLREVDLAYPDRKIAIEYDGFNIHHDAAHFHRDREKAALLQLAGWLVLQVTKAWTAEVLVARVRQALALRPV